VLSQPPSGSSDESYQPAGHGVFRKADHSFGGSRSCRINKRWAAQFHEKETSMKPMYLRSVYLLAVVVAFVVAAGAGTKFH
jgi:hypothetical protein